MDTQPITTPIKSGEMVLPYYEGHYYVSYRNGNSDKEEVIIKSIYQIFIPVFLDGNLSVFHVLARTFIALP